MLSSIHIQGFKGFKDTKIEPLRRVNLIVGGQNSGKTSLLEAIEAGINLDTNNYRSSPSHLLSYISNTLQQSVFRKNVSFRQANSIADSKNCNILVNYTSQTQNFRLKPSTFSVYPVEEQLLVQLYDVAVKNKTKTKIIKLLKQVDSRLEALESVAADKENKPCLHADIGLMQLIPISMLGQGFNRLTYLYSGLLGQGANCTLIDELENGIHYSALPTVWQGIANIASELNIQLFITTHSKECITAAIKVFENSPEDFQLIRLEREADNVVAKCIPHDRVNNVLDMGLEVR